METKTTIIYKISILFRFYTSSLNLGIPIPDVNAREDTFCIYIRGIPNVGSLILNSK